MKNDKRVTRGEGCMEHVDLDKAKNRRRKERILEC